MSLKFFFRRLRDIVKRLHLSHFQTLAYLMAHLKMVSNENESMTTNNLAIVFAPSLMRIENHATSGDNENQDAFRNTMKRYIRAIDLMIYYENQIFSSKEPIRSGKSVVPNYK